MEETRAGTKCPDWEQHHANLNQFQDTVNRSDTGVKVDTSVRGQGASLKFHGLEP